MTVATATEMLVTVATDPADRVAAARLVRDCYVGRGLLPDDAPPMLLGFHALLPDSSCVIAKRGDEVVASITLYRDGKFGLPIESEWPEVIAEYRRRGDVLVEYGSVACRREERGGAVIFLVYLAATRLARKLGGTRTVGRMVPRGLDAIRPLFGDVALNVHPEARPVAFVGNIPHHLLDYDTRAAVERFAGFDGGDDVTMDLEGWATDGERARAKLALLALDPTVLEPLSFAQRMQVLAELRSAERVPAAA